MALAFPSLRDYARDHGYEIVVGDAESFGRPPAWGKVPFLKRLLESYDFVVWIDADALILDGSIDLESIVPADAFQAYAITRSFEGWGSLPCTGVWAFRAGPRAQQFLDAVWEQDGVFDHGWEQTAMMRLTGWTLEPPIVKERASEWDDGTFVLAEEWDMIPAFPIGYAPGKIRHYNGWAYRRRKFDMRTDLARARGSWIRYGVGALERRWRPLYQPPVARLRSWAHGLSPRRAR